MSGMTMITDDYEPLPLLDSMATMIATTMAETLRSDDPDRIMHSLVAVETRLYHAWGRAADDMDDDTLTAEIEDMTPDQLERLQDQGSITAGLRLAHLALAAMTTDFATANGITIESIPTD